MLNYIYRYPKADGSIAFLDILIHANKSTLIYRKPTNNNLYTHYSSSASMSSKESTVRTLTRRAFKLCSPQHLEDELSHLENTFLSSAKCSWLNAEYLKPPKKYQAISTAQT